MFFCRIFGYANKLMKKTSQAGKSLMVLGITKLILMTLERKSEIMMHLSLGSKP